MASVEDNIIHSIKKNGYPQKKVALPFQSIFKACKSNNVSVSDVLKNLEASNIKSKIDGDKILFFDGDIAEQEDKTESSFGFSNKVVADAMKKLRELDPKELEKLKQQVKDMTPEEREAILKKAKDLFPGSSW